MTWRLTTTSAYLGEMSGARHSDTHHELTVLGERGRPHIDNKRSFQGTSGAEITVGYTRQSLLAAADLLAVPPHFTITFTINQLLAQMSTVMRLFGKFFLNKYFPVMARCNVTSIILANIVFCNGK